MLPLPERHIPNPRRHGCRWRESGLACPPEHITLSEVGNDSELHRSLVREQAESLVVSHGSNVWGVQEVVVLDVASVVRVEYLPPPDTEHLLEHLRRLDVESRKEHPCRHSSVHDRMSVKASVSGFELGEALENDRDRYPPRSRRRDDAREIGNGKMPEFIQEEIDGKALVRDVGIFEAVVEEIGIEKVHEERIVRYPVLGNDEE